MVVSGSNESTLLQAIRSLEKGDEEAVQLAERGGAEPKSLRRSPRKADGGGAAAGGSSSNRASQQTLLKPTESSRRLWCGVITYFEWLAKPRLPQQQVIE